MHESISFSNRIEGGLAGLLIGDALGVPYEFYPPESLPPLAQIEMTPPRDFARAHPATPPGTWSDDGAQALALLASLLEKGTLDLHDFSDRLLAWYEGGYMAVDGRVFDVGIQTQQAFTRLRKGVAPAEAGPSGEYDNGNGSLMRALPLALWHRGPDETLIEAARQQSLVTHGHLRAQLCCALYCLWARRQLQGDAQAWDSAIATMRSIYPRDVPERDELEKHILSPRAPQGTGYVVDTLQSARWAVAEGNNYEEVVKLAISLGHDTDTTACVAGGIAGIRYGIGGIPDRWRGLRGEALVAPLRLKLLAWHQDGASGEKSYR